MVRDFQPESKCQFLEVNALIWKGLGSFAVESSRRISACVSFAATPLNAPLDNTFQLATAPTPRKAVSSVSYSVENVPTVMR